MAEESGDLEISIDDLEKNIEAGKKKRKPKDTPTVELESNAVKTEPEPAKVDEPPKEPAATVAPADGVAKLQKQLSEERAIREETERRNRELEESELDARTKKQESDLGLVQNAITVTTQKIDALEAQLSDAFAAGDHGLAAKLQRQMVDATADLKQLKAGEEMIKNAPKPERRALADPVEEIARKVSPRSAAWVRSHPDFIRDPTKNEQMLGAERLVRGRGVKVDSDEYFSEIEKLLGLHEEPARRDDPPLPGERPLSAASDADTKGREVPKPNGQAGPASAPVSRSGTGSGERQRTIRLTAEEVDMARNMGQTPEEYAAAKMALQKAGRMN